MHDFLLGRKSLTLTWNTPNITLIYPFYLQWQTFKQANLSISLLSDHYQGFWGHWPPRPFPWQRPHFKTLHQAVPNSWDLTLSNGTTFVLVPFLHTKSEKIRIFSQFGYSTICHFQSLGGAVSSTPPPYYPCLTPSLFSVCGHLVAGQVPSTEVHFEPS